MKKLTIILYCFLIFSLKLNAQKPEIFQLKSENYPQFSIEFGLIDSNQNVLKDFEQEHLKIYENGQQVEIDSAFCHFPEEQKSLSVVLSIDVSGSMYGKNIDIAKEAAKTFINLMSLDVSECAVTGFDHDSYVVSDFSQNKKHLKSRIDELDAGGGTDYNIGFSNMLTGALYTAKKGIYPHKIIIFLTDGLSTADAEKISDMAKKENISVFCITIDLKIPEQLKTIAKQSEGLYFEEIKTPDEAKRIYTQIYRKFNAGYCTLNWTSPFNCINYRMIELEYAEKRDTVDITFNEDLDVTPTILNFGEVIPGETVTKTISIRAYQKPMIISAINNPAPKIIQVETGILPLTIGAYQNKSIKVSFTPPDSTFYYLPLKIKTGGCKDLFLDITGGFPQKELKSFSENDKLKVVYPNGGEKFIAGDTVRLLWSGANEEDTIKLFYTLNNGKNWYYIGSSSRNNHRWELPIIESSQCKVRAMKKIDIFNQFICRIENTNEEIKQVFIHPINDNIITQEGNQKITVYDSFNKKIIYSINDITANIIKMKLSTNAKYISVWRDNNSISVYETETGKPFVNTKITKTINDFEFNELTKIILVKFEDNTAILKNLNTKNQEILLELTDYKKTAFTSNGNFVCLDKKNKLTVYNIFRKKLEYKCKKRTQYKKIIDFGFSNNAKNMIILDNNNVVRAMDIRWYKVTDNYKLATKNITNFVSNLYFDVFMYKLNDTLFIHNYKNDTKQYLPLQYKYIDYKFSLNGRKIITLTDNQKLMIWELKGLNLIKEFTHKNSISFFNINMEGDKIISQKDNHQISTWFINNGKKKANIETKRKAKNYFEKNATEKSFFVQDFCIGIVKDRQTKKQVELLGHKRKILAGQFSPDYKLIATASVDNTLKIWNTTTGKILTDIDLKNMTPYYWQFIKDNKYILIQGEKKVEIRNVLSGDLILKSRNQLFINELGSEIASIRGDDSIVIYNSNFLIIKSIKLPVKKISSVFFTQDSSFLIVGTPKNTHLLDLKKNMFVCHFNDAIAGYERDIFNQKKNLLLTKNTEKLFLWDITTGELLTSYPLRSKKIMFAPDEETIIMGNEIWNLPYIKTLKKDDSDSTFSILKVTPEIVNVQFQPQFVQTKYDKSIKNYISNPSEIPLTIKRIYITGKNNSDFDIITGKNGFLIPSKSTKQVEFRFQPTRIGIRKATVCIETSYKTFFGEISGMALLKDFKMPELVNFDSITPLTKKDSLVTIIENTGTTTLKIEKIIQKGPDMKQFIFSDLSQKELKAGEKITVPVTFAPVRRGMTSGKILIYFKNMEKPEYISLVGYGNAPRWVFTTGILTKPDGTPAANVEIAIYDVETKRLIFDTITSPDGYYEFKVPVDRMYEIIPKNSDLLTTGTTIDLTRLVLEDTIKTTIGTGSFEVGTKLTLNQIYFDFGKSTLRQVSKYELDRLFQLLKNNPALEIEIGGHTDNVGSLDFNKKLSQGRAEAVMNYLIKKGISPTRLTAKGYADLQSIATNETDEGRQKNRRVEFKIIKK